MTSVANPSSSIGFHIVLNLIPSFPLRYQLFCFTSYPTPSLFLRYQLFCFTFCHLPLCHVLADEVFIVHGGLFSKDNVKLSDIEGEDRIREPPEAGLLVDMLWSDPHPAPSGRFPSKRGVGCQFGASVTKNFLEGNNLSMVVRSHEMKENGYEIEHNGRLMTIFSAPNYCDQMKNQGAFIRYKKFAKDDDKGRTEFAKDQLASIKECNKNLRELAFKVTKFHWVDHPPRRSYEIREPDAGEHDGDVRGTPCLGI